MAHIINRLQFEVRCAGEAQAFNLRSNFSITLQEQIAAVIDAVCSQYVTEDEWLRVDKIEIDAGHFTQHAFEENFAAVFKNRFEKELTGQLSRISPQQKKASVRLSKTALLQYFLQKGILPWWADEATINADEIIVELLAQQPEEWGHFFYQHRAAARLWKRIAFQFNTIAKSAIIQLIEELKNAKAAIISWLQQALVITQNTTGINASFSEEMVDYVIINNALEIFHYPNNKKLFWKIMKDNTTFLFTEHTTVVAQTLEINKVLFIKNEKGDAGYSINDEQPVDAAVMTGAQTNTVTKETTAPVAPEEAASEEEKYVVKHSGIVLLAPFLKRFFTNLHLLNDVEWKDKEAQYKAIHLLKCLSTGKQRIAEYNLTLEKILCGLTIEEPIPAEVMLSEEEANEAQSLLLSVIEHWKALKNTSVNGLRETFLKRDGILKREDNGWLLQVERKTLDVLIDSIPWGCSTIHFPWNTYPVFVEW